MHNSFFKSIILTFIFVSSLFASNEEINQKLFELKTSQEYAQKINDEKITLIMGQIIQKENEIKELEKELKEYVNKEDLQKEITYQNNRIDDINSNVDRLSVIVSISIGLFGILITGIVIFFAFRFERIARVQADKEVKSWIDEKADEEFKPKVDVYLEQIDDRAKKLFEKINELYNENRVLSEKLKDEIQLSRKDTFSKLEIQKVNEQAQKVERTKEKDKYTFEDKYKIFLSKILNNEISEIDALEELRKFNSGDLKDIELIQLLRIKAIIFANLGNEEKEIKVYEEVINRFKNSRDSKVLEEVANSLYAKGITLAALSKNNEAIKSYDELLNRFKNSKDTVIVENVVKALYNKGINLSILNRHEEALSTYNQIINTYKDSKSIKILEIVANALFNKARTFGVFFNYYKSIETCEELINRFKESKHSNILEEVAKALFYKGTILVQLDRRVEAIEVYDEVVQRFKDSKNNTILNQVVNALVNKIEINLILNKANSQKDLKLFFQLVKEYKNELNKYKMLTLLEKAKDSEIDNEIEDWKQEFKDTSIENWSFSELKDWAISFENKEVKERLSKYIYIFENHNKK